jgi:hypothetical protein
MRQFAPTILSLFILALPVARSSAQGIDVNAKEKQITRGPGGRILTNTGAWSPDGEWIVYDVRSDPAGEIFDGDTIKMVNVKTGETRDVFQSKNGAHCGVASFNPRREQIVFILGPENPTPDWQYGMWHRQGAIVDLEGPEMVPGKARMMDARDLAPPFTPGALRGGTHLHVWDGAGEWVASTYEDHPLAQFKEPSASRDMNLRNIAVSVPGRPVRAGQGHPRNHSGEYFTALVTRTTAGAVPGSDEIVKASEEGWVGTNGYARPDGTRQLRSLAFAGRVLTAPGVTNAEVFIVELPADIATPGDGPLEGTETRMPFPPRGAVQRRLTRTTDRKFPGLSLPRHWLRSSPDGSLIAFLMKDDNGVAQIWTISPNGGSPRQVTRNPWPVASAFTWSPDGRHIAHAMDNSVFATEVASGRSERLTARTGDAEAPRPEACVYSPDGRRIAFIRRVPSPEKPANQICVVTMTTR